MKLEVWKKSEFIFSVYAAVTVVASVHKYVLDQANNYLIYKMAFFNLVSGANLYRGYPEANLDLFKYSPAFALLLGPVAILPNALGVVVWNLLNVVPLFFAIQKLALEEPKKILVYWIIALELLTSVQNSQSNGLLTALIVFAFVSFEGGKNLWAAFFVVFASALKIYAIIAAVLLVFYSDKVKFLVYLFFWLALFAILPLVCVNTSQLAMLYSDWLTLLMHDYGLKGLSVMGTLKAWFGLDIPNLFVQGVGGILLGLPLLKRRAYNQRTFRYLFLSSLLIWMTIFNPKAESPTYIVAVTGVALWYVTQPLAKGDFRLLALTLVLTSLSSTDIFPRYLKINFFVPYALKALPVILVWLKIEYQFLVGYVASPEFRSAREMPRR